MTDAQLIPLDLLFGEPAYLSPALSPDGTHIAYLAPHNGVLNIWAGLRGKDFSPVTDNHGRGILGFCWAHDGRHLLYMSDHEGDEQTHVHAVDLVGGGTRDLTPFDGVRAYIVGIDRRVPRYVLVGMNLRDPRRHDVYRVDLAGGEPSLVAENTGFSGWIADRELRIRGARGFAPDGGSSIMVRDTEEADWRTLHVMDYEDSMTSQAIGFTDDGLSLLVLSSVDSNTTRLLRLDVATGVAEVLYQDPRHDVRTVNLHPLTRQADLVVVERERNHLEALDPAVADDVARIRAIGDGDMIPLGRDGTGRTWLVQENVDDAPAGYHVYDGESGETELLFTHQPEFARYPLARMEPFSFTARDGLTIDGYLSFPPGLDRRSLPAVLNVHGGPWDRDRWGLRVESQWLATRGYLCVQVNFRGSSGYGKDFLNAGSGEWGARMHDDLIDAVRWVTARGFADPDRIGVYGTSYGGYAALVGAAFTPEEFRCAVSVAGPSNLLTFVESVPPYWGPVLARLKRYIGDPETQADLLWSRSPLSRVGDIRIPILIAQGANDPRVRPQESEQIVAALREKGVAHEYLLFDDEGHGFVNPRNRLTFYAAAERFLARHLGGRNTTPGR
ncbi:S9 family peptidase [Streptosporangium sp. NPDC001559]|uniref:S9 family peptidase n=1 Tax=Streptosporangium sp. NPDC001559 TaxID=3366187 RepID=UPI0036E71F07